MAFNAPSQQDAAPKGPGAGPGDAALPLAVNLCRTRLLTDTLFDAVAEHLCRRPIWTVGPIIQPPLSFAKVKACIRGDASGDITRLPVNRAVADHCARARAAGRHTLATATVSPLILVLYLIDSDWRSGIYQTPEALWIVLAALAGWLMQIGMLANRDELDDDPMVFAIREIPYVPIGALLAAGVVAAALLPPGSAHMLNVNDLVGLHVTDAGR